MSLEKLFPLCVCHDMPQRSPEWDAIRIGKLTASAAGAWIASEKVNITTTKARESAINLMLAGQMGYSEPSIQVDPDGPVPKNPALAAIYYGIKYEAEALSMLSFDRGLDLEEVGFCEHESGLVGCSPDSLVSGESIVVENKVTMLARIQIARIRAKVIPFEYRDQVHFQMASTGAKASWFQSYHPELPPLQLYIERDEYTEAMASGINRFVESFKSAAEEWNGFPTTKKTDGQRK